MEGVPQAQGVYGYCGPHRRDYGSISTSAGRLHPDYPIGMQWLTYHYEKPDSGNPIIRKIELDRSPDAPQVIYVNVPCSRTRFNRYVIKPDCVIEDVNDDGYLDFVIPYIDEAGKERGRVWLFDPQKRELVRAPREDERWHFGKG